MEQQIVERIAHAKSMGKIILMPGARKFEDVFATAAVVTSEDLGRRIQQPTRLSKEWAVDEFLPHGRIRKGTGLAGLCTFCSVRSTKGRRSGLYFDVTVRPEVLELIENHMMLGDGYRINFEIVAYDDNTALVCAHYNMISGDRWFAYIDADTIPDYKK
jgi:hypothetical protein